MTPSRRSKFVQAGLQDWIRTWELEVLRDSGTQYRSLDMRSDWGETWVHVSPRTDLPPLVFLHGFRTCAAFWEIDRQLRPLHERFQVILVDVAGQPGGSTPYCPPLDGPGYGHWLAQVLDSLGLDRVSLVGASFGGIAIVRLAEVAPERIVQAALVCPAGLVPVNMGSPRTFLYNMLPVWWPTRATVRRFLDAIVFHAPTHTLSGPPRERLERYLLRVLTGFRCGAELPRPLSDVELAHLTAPTSVLLGSHDPMFPLGPASARARQLTGLREVHVLEGHGHGAETSHATVARLLACLS
ncbi:MAG: alpha/beta hydrolase [Candidatus Eremiobacterota bacterium]